MMHGHEPGQVVPDTALILSHKHPDDDGRTVATRGFYIDVTDSEQPGPAAAGDGPEAAAEPHNIVEQATGMLMLASQVDADTASRMLRWRSKVVNVELAWIAERVVADFPALMNQTFPGCPVLANQYLSTLSAPL